jgi:hypothetical protein
VELPIGAMIIQALAGHEVKVTAPTPPAEGGLTVFARSHNFLEH